MPNIFTQIFSADVLSLLHNLGSVLTLTNVCLIYPLCLADKTGILTFHFAICACVPNIFTHSLKYLARTYSHFFTTCVLCLRSQMCAYVPNIFTLPRRQDCMCLIYPLCLADKTGILTFHSSMCACVPNIFTQSLKYLSRVQQTHKSCACVLNF